MSQDIIISVVGLGYVGLPVAVAMSEKYKTIGFDINNKRIEELISGHDRTNEVEDEELKSANIFFSSDPGSLKEANFHIIAVPTPVNNANIPDLSILKSASSLVGKIIKKNDIIVFESTVYPGATEEECLPILEQESGLKSGEDFFIGYSPERINPGDKEHTFKKIKKVVSAQTPESLETVAQVYGSVVEAGIHRAESLKVAEAAKVIENTQRDLNIALMNELSVIFDHLKIDTLSVLKAASTKWNFLNFKPGLVGGHCIGVDPYYLTYKAESIGYHPQVILAGRRINDSMGSFLAQKLVKALINNERPVKGATVTIFGLTFKENCPDLRNTKVIDIIRELEDYGMNVQVTDPLADPEDARHEYDTSLVPYNELKKADAAVMAVAHSFYVDLDINTFLDTKLNSEPIILDIKGIFKPENLSTQAVLLRC